MPIHFLKGKPTDEQVQEMLLALEDYNKLAVDVSLRRVAGGGVMHADCEEVLLNEGSSQEDVWGADWYPEEKTVDFGSLINIRPRQGNRSMQVEDPELRRRIEEVVRAIFQ
jgi:hypothetical protein